jgi:hypothetical protein
MGIGKVKQFVICSILYPTLYLTNCSNHVLLEKIQVDFIIILFFYPR